MDWIDKLNKELEERRERNKTPEAKEEAISRMRKAIASIAGTASMKKHPIGKKSPSEQTRKKIQKSCGATPILQFTYDETKPNGIGEFVKEWPSRNSAIKEYGTGVVGVLKGGQKYCKGFKFIWKKDYKYNGDV
jgi:hypothetical protein